MKAEVEEVISLLELEVTCVDREEGVTLGLVTSILVPVVKIVLIGVELAVLVCSEMP